MEERINCYVNEGGSDWSSPLKSEVSDLNMLPDEREKVFNEEEKKKYGESCCDDYDIHPVKQHCDGSKDRSSLCSDSQSTGDIQVSGPRQLEVDCSDIDNIEPQHQGRSDQQTMHRGSEIVDKAALRIMYSSDETDSKKLTDPVNKDDVNDGTGNNEDNEILEIDRYLKKPLPAPVGRVTITVNMLHVQLPTPVAERHGTADSAFLEKYKSELHRLGSYFSFPPDTPGFVSKLSRDGFIFMPEENAIVCYFCKTKITLPELKQPGVDAIQLHLDRSPLCPFKLGTSTNQATHVSETPLVPFNHARQTDKVGLSVMTATSSVDKGSVLTAPISNASNSPVSHNKTPNSFTSNQTHSVDSGIEVADSCPLVQQPQGTTMSVNITGSLPNQSAHSHSQPTSVSTTIPAASRNGTASSTVSHPAEVTASRSTASNFTPPASSQQASSASSENNTEASKEKKKLTYSDLGIFADKPKRPDMAILSKRLATFAGKWKASYVQTPQVLAEAGMYYAGYSDCARCFFCGGGLKNWEPPDNPWVEHARWFPKCAYVSMARSPQFVEIVKRKNQNKEEIKLKDVEDEIAASISQPVSIDVGANCGRKPADSSSASRTNDQGMAAVADTNQERGIAELKAENEELKSQTTCKICMDFESTVVFLPCGHLVACTNCAIVLKICPVCRSDIKGSVRANLS